jgi:hypothetical protein
MKEKKQFLQADSDIEHFQHGSSLKASDGHDDPDHSQRVEGELLAQQVHALLQRSSRRLFLSHHPEKFLKKCLLF